MGRRNVAENRPAPHPGPLPQAGRGGSGLFSCLSILGFSDLSSSKRRAGAVLRSRMGVLIGTPERLSSDPPAAEPHSREKQNHGRPRTQSPRRVKTDDRSDVRQQYVRFYKCPNRFRAFGEADGRQPFIPCDYPSNPCLWALCFVVARGDAAAFRRARFGLSSSERQYAIIPIFCQGISEKCFRRL
jgi:hypothetical protein